MGGRGSLSPNAHKMYNIRTIYDEMKKTGVEVYGLQHISRKGLSLVVEALETVQKIEKKHGKLIDTVIIGLKRNSDFSFIGEFAPPVKPGRKQKSYGRTLVIPLKTAQSGKVDLEKAIKTANKYSNKENKVNFVVAKNVKQMVYHEMGHAVHYALKKSDPDSYREFERRFATLVKNPSSRVNLSHYAKTKAYNGKIGSHEYVAESMVHILRNTKTRKGQDMVDLVWDFMSRVPSTNFSSYGSRRSKTPTIQVRPGRPKTIKRRRKK